MTAAPIDPGAIVTEARRWIGTPYRHAASVRGVGCDCLGLVRGVWRALYGDEPEPMPVYSADWAEATRRETLRDTAARHMGERPRDAAVAGDLLLFRWREGLPVKHCGIATGEGRMVHAHDGARVVEIDLGLWRPRLAYVYRFPNVREPGP